MIRYRLAAAAAALALAAATPAAANPGAARPAITCAVPAAAEAPVLPISPDSALEDKIEQLTQVITDLSDRLASVEDALGDDPDDADGDGGDDGLDLVRLPGAARPGLVQRHAGHLRAGQPQPFGKALATRRYAKQPPLKQEGA